MKCFVVSPIGEAGSKVRIHADKFYDYIIMPTCIELGHEVTRSDKLNTPGIITDEVLELLDVSDVVIADLTGFNPNVFYEVGYREAFKKPMIFFRDKNFDNLGDIPFDLKLHRVLPYSPDHGDVVKAINMLKDVFKYIDTKEQYANPSVEQKDNFYQEIVNSLAEIKSVMYSTREDSAYAKQGLNSMLAGYLGEDFDGSESE